MKKNLSQKQFSQLKLPLGDVEGSKIKQPHQMSPEEFASHPFAVFHTTHLPTEKVLDAGSRFDPGIHLGTDIAASQRHLVTGNKSMTSFINGKIVEPHTQPATMHVFHHDPGEKLFKITTKAGRYVTVTANKSLLVWNANLNQFREEYTEDVKVGDFVPVAKNINELQNSIPIQENLRNCLKRTNNPLPTNRFPHCGV